MGVRRAMSVSETPSELYRLGAVTAVPGDLTHRFALLGSFPNPFAGRTEIRFTLAEPGPATLTIHGLDGRRIVDLLTQGDLRSGSHSVAWSGRDGAGRLVASGIYLARLSAGDRESVIRLLLMRSRAPRPG